MKSQDNVDLNGMKIELLGSFMFFYVGGWSVIHSSKSTDSDALAPALAHMFTLALMIWSAAHVSGGHFNPAVTTTLIVFKRCNWVKGIFFIMAQFLGGLFAGSVLKVLMPADIASEMQKNHIYNGFPKIDVSEKQTINMIWLKSLIIEIIGTFFLVTMVYMNAVYKKAPENVHGITIGGAVGFMIISAPAYAAVGLNPARALGPLLIDAVDLGWYLPTYGWIWLVGPIIGALLAGLMCEFLIDDIVAGQVKIDGDLNVSFASSGSQGKSKKKMVVNEDSGEIGLSLGGSLNVQLEATMEIELEGRVTGPEVQVEVDVPEINTELVVEAPEVEIEVEVEAPEVEIEVNLGGGVEAEVEVEVEAEVELGGEIGISLG